MCSAAYSVSTRDLGLSASFIELATGNSLLHSRNRCRRPHRHGLPTATPCLDPPITDPITPTCANNFQLSACRQTTTPSANMSTPRGGRGGERGRGTRGANPFARGLGPRGRGNGNGNSTTTETTTERPTQTLFARGTSPRGGNRGGAALRGNANPFTPRGSTNTRASTRGRGNHS